jgi:hypothetical protein
MVGSVKITLSEPIQWFDKKIESVVLNQPKGRLYMLLGEPRFVVSSPAGQFWHEKDDVIAKYIAELLTLDGEKKIDGGDAIFSAMSLSDVIAIKDAVLGFFMAAHQGISERRPTG